MLKFVGNYVEIVDICRNLQKFVGNCRKFVEICRKFVEIMQKLQEICINYV